MVTGTYRELFVAVAGAAGALTGLLFVALSVAPRPRMAQHPDVIRQVRAAAALVAFTNALAISLFGLVPNNLVGYPAAIAGAVGLLFTLGGLRSILADPAARPRARSQMGLILLLLAAFGVEIVAGAIAVANPHAKVPIDVIGNVMVAALLIGVARSWELVGDRDTGISGSIAALIGREHHLGGPWPARPMSRVRMRRSRLTMRRLGVRMRQSRAERSSRRGKPRRGKPSRRGRQPRQRARPGRGRQPRREARLATAARRAVPGRPPRELSAPLRWRTCPRVSGVRNRGLMFGKTRPGGRPPAPDRPAASGRRGEQGR